MSDTRSDVRQPRPPGEAAPPGRATTLLRAGAALLAAWTMQAALRGRIDPLLLAIVFFAGTMTLVFAAAALRAKTPRRARADAALAACALGAGSWFAAQTGHLRTRMPLFEPLTPLELAAGLVLIALALEATRRTVGPVLAGLAALALLYNLAGHLLPGQAGHGLITLAHFVDLTVYTSDGLFGPALRVAATYVLVFVVFGTAIAKAGGGQVFHDLGAALAGRGTGGLGKVAVVSSGLFGTISGSPTADVVTTGSITIPAMRRHGYPGPLAGGIEVAASTGGGLLPPVMGSAAFLMAEMTGIGYGEIVLAALVPALLYYASVMAQVHFRAGRLGLAPMAPGEIPPLSRTLRQGWPFALPFAAVAWALASGYTPLLAGGFGLAATLLVAALRLPPAHWPGFVLDTLAEASLRVAAVVGACAAAGLILTGLTMTGLAPKLAALAFGPGAPGMAAAILASAGLALLLGLGMPVPGAYLLAAAVAGPILVASGVDLLPAHLFLLYFSVLSAITPPIAVAAFAAAAIAGEPPMRVALAAVRLAAAAFLLPFAFVLDPALLLQGPVLGSLLAVPLAALGAVLLAASVEGRLAGPVSGPGRAVLLGAALCLLSPSPALGLAGLAAAGLLVGARRRSRGGTGAQRDDPS